jgi:hypothetical protein
LSEAGNKISSPCADAAHRFVQADHLHVTVGHFRLDDHEVHIGAGVGVAAPIGAEQDHPAGPRHRDNPVHSLMQRSLVNHASHLSVKYCFQFSIVSACLQSLI